MKNQYFGDINDYRKYGLLRCLSQKGKVSIAVCWMLTENDTRPDGEKLKYLENPQIWGRFDPKLFEVLRKEVIERGNRNINIAQKRKILSSSLYYNVLLKDNKANRTEYFNKFLDQVKTYDVVFFDPDNGFEIPSRPFGRIGSSKFLYWDEVFQFTSRGQSALIYQHFSREPRDRFIRKKAEQLANKMELKTIYSFSTPHVVFFLALQDNHLEKLTPGIELIKSVWQRKIKNTYQIKVEFHDFRPKQLFLFKER